MSKKLALRVISSLLLFVALFLLESCGDEHPVKPVKPVPSNPQPDPDPTPIPPVIPLPGTPCNASVLTGYTDKQSYFQGDSVIAFIDTSSKIDCHLDVYDIKGVLAMSVPASLF